MQAKGIEYFTYPELPDQPRFNCDRMLATLQVSTCAGMWTEANGKNPPERLAKCKTCPVGAAHAGESDFDVSAIRGSGLCARCHRAGFRLIGGDICVSCWNRAREVLKGCNRRGKVPVNHPPLEAREIRVKAGGELVVIRREHSISTEELMVAALRDCTRQPLFGLYPGRQRMPIAVQGELF